MLKKMGQRLKNERGLTLIELLAVVVILGIIAAIAIPSIGGLIDNSRKDAHIANAKQMISSAKIAVSSNEDLRPAKDASVVMSLGDLETKGYLDKLKDPDGGTESDDGYLRGSTGDTDGSYVTITNEGDGKFAYTVTLKGSKRTISESSVNELDRDSVQDNS
ncbi:type II secretion system protein [Rossellomorea sp. YZS02]|uniref:type II secretion system protein n=1 Tax=Rossellomorea sp. YZS02 TaxID=3097358 RepID=UPI002A0F924A|nr:type II secretion system protein [Rossellomorea sp. YZS02]MDX8342014.1 type II secretion system protein [Rossellomorea sp. YZS02]